MYFGGKHFRPFLSLKHSAHPIIVTYILNYFPSKGPRQDDEVKNLQQGFSCRENRRSIPNSKQIALSGENILHRY